MSEAGEHAERHTQAGQPGVGKRHAIADTGRAKLLAFDDLPHDLIRGETGSGRSFGRELLKQPLFVARADVDHDLSRQKELADLHGPSSSPAAPGLHTAVAREETLRALRLGCDDSVAALLAIQNGARYAECLRPSSARERRSLRVTSTQTPRFQS